MAGGRLEKSGSPGRGAAGLLLAGGVASGACAAPRCAEPSGGGNGVTACCETEAALATAGGSGGGGGTGSTRIGRVVDTSARVGMGGAPGGTMGAPVAEGIGGGRTGTV